MRSELLIQIINYNTREYLAICLESLFADLIESGIDYRVIVLDNNSKDDLGELEQLYAGKNISFHYSEHNLGFGGGHNLISKMEQSNYMLILNSDIKFIEKDSVWRLYNRLKESTYNVIGPKLVENDMKQQRFDHGEIQGISSWIKNNYGMRCTCRLYWH